MGIINKNYLKWPYNHFSLYLLTNENHETKYGYKHPPKPIGIAVELADVLIRIADTCGRYNIPLEEALKLKLAYNKTRPHRHGGKKL